MYVPDPAAVLRRQATVLRGGGLVVPIEFDIPAARALPATPLASQALAWVVQAFAKGGIQPAGDTAVGHPAGGGAASARDARDPAALWTRRSRRHHPGLAGVIRTAAPLIERTGVATAEEIGVETFAQRLRDELRVNQAVFAYPTLLSAWGTTDEA